jgi:trans-2,3-dihydro-3-hydroxyanthranilate isomerase
MKLTIVDVFAESKYAGNQLAVVQGAGALSTQTMQAIALEMNYSETTFVTAQGADSARVRIFTPNQELPFAGHPTLGTAWVLAGGVGTFTLELAAGLVPVRFEEGLGWLTPPPVVFGEHLEPAAAAALLGLEAAALDPNYPAQFAEVGPKFVLIGLKRLVDLKRAKLDEALYYQYLESGLPSQSVFVFSSEAYAADAHFGARMFFHAGGLREDPATGSANCAFAAYLRELQGEIGLRVVDQGVEIQRPSRLYLEIGQELAVGGRVFVSAVGELT